MANRRFLTTTCYVEGRKRPRLARFRLSSQPKLVILCVLAPTLALLALVFGARLETALTLLCLIVWVAVSVYVAYVFSDDLFGSFDRFTVDLKSAGVRFRGRWPADQVALGWGALTLTLTGAMLVVQGLALEHANSPLREQGYVLDPRAWIWLGGATGALGVALFAACACLCKVPPGIALTSEGVAFRRGLAEERRSWGEIRSVTWSGRQGMSGKLRIDFSEDRPLTLRSWVMASNAELVAQLIEFYRTHPQWRKSLTEVNDMIETFEQRHTGGMSHETRNDLG